MSFDDKSQQLLAQHWPRDGLSAAEEYAIEAQLAIEGERRWLHFQRAVVEGLLAQARPSNRQERRRTAREYATVSAGGSS